MAFSITTAKLLIVLYNPNLTFSWHLKEMHEKNVLLYTEVSEKHFQIEKRFYLL